MANELRVNCGIDWDNGTASPLRVAFSKLVTTTGGNAFHNVQTVGSSEEALVLNSDITTEGYCLFKNLDTSIAIHIRAASGATNLITLNAGEVALFRLATAASAPYVIAASGTPKLEYWILPD